MLKGQGSPDPFWKSQLFHGQREAVFANRQDVDEDGLVRRAMSASYTPRKGPAAEGVEVALRRAFRLHAAGQAAASLLYRTRVFLAEKA